jgi:hypothetical protein
MLHLLATTRYHPLKLLTNIRDTRDMEKGGNEPP